MATNKSGVRKVSRQSTGEDLRPIYRALGLSEETIARAIQYSRIGPDERSSPEAAKRGRGRPRQNVRLLDQATSPKRRHNRRSRRNILPQKGTEKRLAG
jgi:hypothetical protein